MTRASVDTAPSCSIVICAYTDDRWDLLLKGYQASIHQLDARDQVIVVIDHNPELFNRAMTELPDAVVIQNEGPRGLSGGRNTGVSAASGDIVVFLDDDACPADGWLEAYRSAFGAEDVAVVAGSINPDWVGGRKPSWFPDEFGWVVGCDYRGLPGDQQRVRNPIGANMAIRRDIIEAVGGFSSAVGRVGTKPIGNEETDLSIRINQAKPDLRTIRVTSARVDHVVPGSRQTWKYFLSRCFYEGRSKKILAGRVGVGDGLDSERRYVTRVLPAGFARELLGPLSGKFSGPGRALAIAVGLLATAVGYLSGRGAPADEAAVPPASDTPLAWRPLRVVEYHLDADRPAVVPPVSPERLRLLVLAHGGPVGFLDIEDGEGIPAASEVARRVGYDGATHAAAAPSPAERFMADRDAPMVSVVIATRGRTAELTGCVASVLAQQYPNFEVIIVDNNDDPRRLQELLDNHFTDDRLRIVHESRRGVSVARDRGTQEAHGVLIAATDDDVVVPSTWLPELVAAFDDTTVDCVTGLVVANGFKTPAQELFEEFGGFSKGFEPARYDLGEHRAPEVLYPFSPGVYGSGNNVAFRKAALEAVGGYDRRLGPGTLVKSGEDLDLFLKFLFDGRTLVYQPRARVSHSHRQTMHELHVQIRHYGRGLSAVILKWALSDPRRLADILRRLPAGLSRLLNSDSDRNRGRSASYPASLNRAELRGLVEGSFLLPVQAIRARRQR